MDVVTTPKLSRNPERTHSLNMTGRSMPSAEQNKGTVIVFFNSKVAVLCKYTP
jgi:hypothetical protein